MRDNAVIAAAPTVAVGFHVCRSSQASRRLTEGSYAPIAPLVFRKTKALAVTKVRLST